VLPSGYTYVPASITGGNASDASSPAGTGLTWTINSLASGGSVNLTYQATVLASGNYDNYAQITDHDQPDSNSTPGNGQQTPDEDDDDTVTVTPNAVVNVSLDKQVSTATPNVGSIVTFTLVVANGGPSTATNIDVTDVLPSGYTYVPASITGGNASDASSPAGTGLTWTINSLASGGSVNLTYQATVLASGNYDNYAQITDHDQPDSNSTPGNNSTDEDDDDTVSVTPNAVVNVSLDKQVNDATPNVGDIVTFTLTIANAGPSTATNIDVTDVLPSGYTYVPASITGGDTRNDSSPAGTGLTWRINSLASGGSVNLTYQATVLASGAYDNYAQITDHDQPDSNSTPGNNSTDEDDDDTVSVTPNPVADLSLTKTVNNSSPVVGNNVTFTLTLTNNGPSNATGISVLDLLPSGLSYLSDNSASTVTTYNSGTGVWTIGSLAASDSISLQITVQVTQGGTITNTAEVRTSDQFDPNSTPNNNIPSEDDQASVIVGGIFDPPSALKTFNDLGLPELEFRMVWINSSNIAAIDVQVTDNIPAGTTYVPGSIDCDPQGSSSTVNAGVVTTPVSPLGAAAPAWSCGFDAANNRVQWQGTIGPDDGNLTEAAAANEVIITFRVTVDNAVNQVQNTGSSRTDINDNGDFDEETVLNTSVVNSNIVIWNRAQDPDPETPPVVPPTLPAILPVTGFAPNMVSVLPEQPASKLYSSTGVWLEIPSLGVQMPIVGVPLAEEDWDVSWLGNQAGWLEGTAFPSWKGNSAVTGHVTLADGASGPFAKLGNLKWGDKVVVHAYGYVYTYQVRENKVIAPNNTSVLKHEADSWLTLITCKNYNEATDTYANRVSVRAVLISVQKEPAKLIPLGVR
jgi:LPXTG-site transpeptidase (sortase) family protein